MEESLFLASSTHFLDGTGREPVLDECHELLGALPVAIPAAESMPKRPAAPQKAKLTLSSGVGISFTGKGLALIRAGENSRSSTNRGRDLICESQVFLPASKEIN